MPVSVDARPPGLNLVFRRGTTLTVTMVWPTGELAARTFTATLDAVSLGLAVDGTDTTMTITATVAQTTAADDGPLDFVLTETTGDDQPIIIGTWRASTRPSAVSEQTVNVTEGASTITVDVSGVNPGPELVVADPTELSLELIGDTAQLAVLDAIGRILFPAAPNEYINQQTHTAWATATLIQDAVYYLPYALAKGTIDRLSVEVTTAQAAGTLRMGVYARNGLRPGNRLAESSSGAVSAASLGAKEFTFALAIPTNGLYFVALVAQGAAGIQVRSPNSTTIFPLPLGSTAPSGTTTWGSLAETGVSSALPATAGTTAIDSNDYRCNARYSAVG